MFRIIHYLCIYSLMKTNTLGFVIEINILTTMRLFIICCFFYLCFKKLTHDSIKYNVELNNIVVYVFYFNFKWASFNPAFNFPKYFFNFNNESNCLALAYLFYVFILMFVYRSVSA